MHPSLPLDEEDILALEAAALGNAVCVMSMAGITDWTGYRFRGKGQWPTHRAPLLYKRTGSVNDKCWLGHPPRTVLCLGGSAEREAEWDPYDDDFAIAEFAGWSVVVRFVKVPPHRFVVDMKTLSSEKVELYEGKDFSPFNGLEFEEEK